MSECIPVAKVCDNCACYEVCIYANPGRKKDCSLWKPDMSWIPVSERLPDKKGEYLVAYHPCYWENVHDAFIFVGVDTFRGKTTWAKNKFQRVTHWMPLPEPPKEATNV